VTDQHTLVEQNGSLRRRSLVVYTERTPRADLGRVVGDRDVRRAEPFALPVRVHARFLHQRVCFESMPACLVDQHPAGPWGENNRELPRW
jgi:hypothetical protein